MKRNSYSSQSRLAGPPIDQAQLNADCRDSIVPVLRLLQHVQMNTQSLVVDFGHNVSLPIEYVQDHAVPLRGS